MINSFIEKLSDSNYDVRSAVAKTLGVIADKKPE